MGGRNVHEWKDKDENGEARIQRAWRHLGQWNFLTRLKSEDDWTTLADPDTEFLQILHEKIMAKYRRKRLPWEHVEEIEKLINKNEKHDA